MDFKQFSEKFLDAMRAGDKATMSEMLHPDFICEEAASLPYGGPYRGLDGWLRLCGDVVGAWSKFRIQRLDYAGEGPNSLVIHFEISGRSRKTNKEFSSRVLEYWRFKDGKLLSIDPFYFDTHQLVAADTAE